MTDLTKNPRFEVSDETHVRSYVFYGKAADSKLYYEESYTTQVSQADLENAFIKGMLLIHTISGSTVTYRRATELTGNKVKTLTASGSGTVTTAFTEWQAEATA